MVNLRATWSGLIRYVFWRMSSNILTNPIAKMRFDAIWCNCSLTVCILINICHMGSEDRVFLGQSSCITFSNLPTYLTWSRPKKFCASNHGLLHLGDCLSVSRGPQWWSDRKHQWKTWSQHMAIKFIVPNRWNSKSPSKNSRDLLFHLFGDAYIHICFYICPMFLASNQRVRDVCVAPYRQYLRFGRHLGMPIPAVDLGQPNQGFPRGI